MGGTENDSETFLGGKPAKKIPKAFPRTLLETNRLKLETEAWKNSLGTKMSSLASSPEQMTTQRQKKKIHKGE